MDVAGVVIIRSMDYLVLAMERNPGYVSVRPMRRWDEREGRGMDEGVGGCGGVRVSESGG